MTPRTTVEMTVMKQVVQEVRTIVFDIDLTVHEHLLLKQQLK